MSNRFSPSIMCRQGLAAQGARDDVVDVGRLHAPALALFGIDAQLQVRLAADVEDADVLDAADLLQDVLGLGGQRLPAGRGRGR